MTLSPTLDQALRLVATAMRPASEPWWIIGSAAVALHGTEPSDLRDVDVLLAPSDMGPVLGGLGLTAAPGSAGTAFRSQLFARWDAAPLPVEFMAGLTHRGERVTPRTREPLPIGPAILYAPERAELRAMLTRFGRSKDLRRLALLPT